MMDCLKVKVDEILLAGHLYFGFVCFWHEMEEENHQNEIETRNNLFPTTISPFSFKGVQLQQVLLPIQDEI